MEIYEQSIDNGTCLHPCHYTLVLGMTPLEGYKKSLDNDSSKNVIKLRIKFDETVKVFHAKYEYSFETMMAEIGGYVGLFLGISVYQFTEVIDYILVKVTKYMPIP